MDLDLVGSYKGEYKVREGREDELTRDEVKRYLKSKENLSLELRSDGSFSHKAISHGSWRVRDGKVVLTPTAFGNQTRKEMQEAAEGTGRVFTLAFLFEPFELVIQPNGFVTPDPSSLIYTEYRRT